MLRVCIFSENRKMEAGLRKIVQSYIYENLISVDIKVFRDIKMLLKSDISDAILFINDSEERSAVKTAQILREHDTYANHPGCRLVAQSAEEGGYEIFFTLLRIMP